MFRCVGCPGRTFVKPNGPVPCAVAVFGEAPAREEVRRGYPFAGRSGIEYDNQYLPLAKLERRRVYTSNVVKCDFPGFANPSHAQALSCARHHLGAELAEVNPQFVVTLGAVAASVFETTYTPGGLGRPVDLELDHGRPARAGFGPWTGWLVPTYHPAAGMRQSRFCIPIREDFAGLLGRVAEIESLGAPILPVDQFPNPRYEEITDPLYLASILCEHPEYRDGPAIDTESDGPVPWSLQFCLYPGAAYLIAAHRRDLLTMFRDWLAAHRPLVILHNALHDLSTLLDMDPPIPVPRWIDTMMLAYHAQEFSHGLKPLAYRYRGMPMRDYDDVVRPHSLVAVESHAVDVVTAIEREFHHQHTFKSGNRKGQSESRFQPRTPDEVRYTYARYQALLRSCQSPPDEFDPWKREWRPEAYAWAEMLTGSPFPRKSIVHVPRAEAIQYAASDADATLRILPILRRRARRIGDMVLEAA